MSDETRITGHRITFDNMGVGRVLHPISCDVPRSQCEVVKLVQYPEKVRGFKGPGEYLGTILNSLDGSIDALVIWPTDVHGFVPRVTLAGEVHQLLDRFVAECASSKIARLAIESYVGERWGKPVHTHVVDL